MAKEWPCERGVIRELNCSGFILDDDCKVLCTRDGR